MNPDELRAEAIAILETKDPTKWALRSCHRCNEAHHHLTNRPDGPLINCFACGHWYYKGVDITITDDTTPQPEREDPWA